MQAMRIVGQRIAAARAARGLSRETFAGWLDIDRSVLGRIERGEVSVNVDRLVNVALLLKVKVAWLVGETRQGGPQVAAAS